jgi:nucleoside-diphosphate-sugar epimerase
MSRILSLLIISHTVNPPFLYGPFTKRFIDNIQTGDYAATSTAGFIHQFLTPNGKYPAVPTHADVRDVARLHVLALSAPPASEVGRKRIIYASPYGFDYAVTRDLIKEKRPELKERLITAESQNPGYDRLPYDFARVEEVLGTKKEELKTFEETILNTVDSLLELEKKWQAEGHLVKVPVEGK